MDGLPEILDEIEEHLLCDSPVPVELVARLLCALPPEELDAYAVILSHHLPVDPKE